jgi:hypothetical protein
LFSLGLFGTALDKGGDGVGVFLTYCVLSMLFFIVLAWQAGALSRSPSRRKYARIAAGLNFLVCFFGMISGFIFFSASLFVLIVLGFAKPARATPPPSGNLVPYAQS